MIILYKCSVCGSENLRFFGELLWDVEKQIFRIDNIHNLATCGTCNWTQEPIKMAREES